MKRVFMSTDVEAQAVLLKVIHEFLESEGERKGASKAQKDMNVLIGTNQDFAESG